MDIRTTWQPDQGRGDYTLVGADLASGGDLANAVLISLFSDRTAAKDDTFDGDDPRGWWGDLDARWPAGSRLWLLEREKLTPVVAARAKDYILEALGWMVEAGLAVKIEVTTEIVRPNRLDAQVVIFRSSDTRVAISYSWAWTNALT